MLTDSLGDSRVKPFGLIIVVNANGNAEGELFYDDGESIDTIGSKSYYYATYKWSARDRQLQINVVENNYGQMSNLMLNSLTIYGLDKPAIIFTVDKKQMQPTFRFQTKIVDVTGLGLSMGKNHTVSWSCLKGNGTIDEYGNLSCGGECLRIGKKTQVYLSIFCILILFSRRNVLSTTLIF